MNKTLKIYQKCEEIPFGEFGLLRGVGPMYYNLFGFLLESERNFATIREAQFWLDRQKDLTNFVLAL